MEKGKSLANSGHMIDNLVDEDLAEQKIDLCSLSETNPKITGNTNLQFHSST